jgi:N-acetylneuraminic acid mutarotase
LSGSFSSGDTYSVAVTAQPAGQTCAVTSASGTVGGSDVTSVQVNCASAYQVGGSIGGLAASGLVLENGSDSVSVAAGATSFTLPTSVANGKTYSLSVKSQPTGLICVVDNGTGTVNGAAVTSVAVTCGQWIWQAGANVVDPNGSWGTIGVPASSNIPGGRAAGAMWKDGSGAFWLFGGAGWDSNGIRATDLSDLWRLDPATGSWTWISGPSTGDSAGSYGTQGLAAPTNNPGARVNPVTWMDASGVLWLFGGNGLDSTGTQRNLNDLWKYAPSTGEWTWVNGPNIGDTAGVYGTLGQAAPGNIPSARSAAVSWSDADGNFWMLGGVGITSPGLSGDMNDLWKYTPSTGLWTWMGGSSSGNALGTYGARGVGSASNIPGARFGASAVTDARGKVWLFGGSGYGASAGFVGLLNDLWTFDPITGEWIWVSGSNTVGASPSFGTLGTPGASVTPGARFTSTAWIDRSGAIWVLGGIGLDITGGQGGLNDLWRFNPTANQWTWISGSQTGNANGVYGTVGVPGNGNTPGARYGGFAWTDNSDNLWSFGGYGVVMSPSYFNDVWEYKR